MGKARRKSAKGKDEDGSTKSVLPTYVYDATKVKKPFEHMRVSFPLVSSSYVLLSFLLFFSFNVIPSHPIS